MARPTAARDPVGDVFKAFTHPGRRTLLALLAERGGRTLGELTRELDLTRQAVSQHLKVLERAGVVVTRRQGRERLHYIDAVPLADAYRKVVAPLITREAQSLLRLRDEIEEDHAAPDRNRDRERA